MTQRVEVFLQYDSKSSTFLVFPYDSKNWTFFFLIWLKELCFLTWLKGLNSLLKLTQKGWTFFLLNMTQWIEPLFEYDSQNWTSFLSMTQRIWIFFLKMTQRNEPIRKKRWNNWTAFCYDSKNWNFFFKKRLKQMSFWVWLTGIEHFFLNFFKMTQRVEPFVFLKMSHRIELFFFFFFKMLKELNLSFIWTIFYMTQWIEFFLNLTRRVEPFFLIWLKELDFFEYDSKN